MGLMRKFRFSRRPHRLVCTEERSHEDTAKGWPFSSERERLKENYSREKVLKGLRSQGLWKEHVGIF